jgi:hypothetical protein
MAMTALTKTPVRRPVPLPWLLAIVVIAVLGISGLMYAWISAPAATSVPYSQFLSDVAAGGISRVVQTGTVLEVSGSRGAYTVAVPTLLTDVYGDIAAAAADEGAAGVPAFETRAEPDSRWLALVVTAVLPVVAALLILGLILVIVGRATRRDSGRSLTARLRELDEAHRSGLVADDEWQRQRARILAEA